MLLGANCRVRLLERSSSMTVGTGPSALKLAESSPMTSKPVKPRAKSPTLVRKTERRSTTPTATTPKSSSAGVTSSEAPSLCKFAFPQDTAAKHHKPAYCSQGCASEDGHVKPYGSLGGRGKRGGRSVFEHDAAPALDGGYLWVLSSNPDSWSPSGARLPVEKTVLSAERARRCPQRRCRREA